MGHTRTGGTITLMGAHPTTSTTGRSGSANVSGHPGRACGEHRPDGTGRAWCFDCHEWCHPGRLCVRCDNAQLRAENTLLRAATQPDGGVVVRHPHTGGDILGYHENVWLGEHVLRDRRGRRHRHGWARFARVICNNPGCQFEALVNAETVAAATRTDV